MDREALLKRLERAESRHRGLGRDVVAFDPAGDDEALRRHVEDSEREAAKAEAARL